MKKTLATAISLFLCLPLSAQENVKDNRGQVRQQVEPKGFLYGVAYAFNSEIYKGYDSRKVLLPVIGYRGERLTIAGPFISYDLATIESLAFSIKAAPRFAGFDESDSDIFIGMNEREMSMDAGVGVKYEQGNWNASFTAMHDVLGRSKGYELKSSFGRVFQFGPVFVEPSMSLSYLDDNHVDYYYGVSNAEATQNRAAYQGHNAINSSLAISLTTPIFFSGFTRLSIQNTWYDGAIYDSPLVDDESALGINLMFTRFF